MKKRILCVAMALTMAFSFTACGSGKKVAAGNKVDITAEQLSEDMQKAVKDVKALKVSADAVLDMKMEVAGESGTIKFDAEGIIEGNIDTPALHAKGEASYEVKAAGENESDSIKGEAYVDSDGDEITAYYTGDGEEWTKDTITKEEFMDGLEGMLSGEAFSDLGISEETTESIPELLPSISDKTVAEEGKECYELTVKVDKSALSGILGATEYSAYLDIFSDLQVTAKYYVDVKTSLPVKLTVAAEMSADDSASGMMFKLNKCELNIKADFDDTVKVEVPADVKSKAVEE